MRRPSPLLLTSLSVLFLLLLTFSTQALGAVATPTPTVTFTPTLSVGGIEGWVFLDSNGDGVYQPWAPSFENPLPDPVTVNLYKGGSLVGSSATTGGWYHFPHPDAGTCSVEEVQPDG